MQTYRGHDDATERAGADAQLLTYLAQRPEIVHRATQRDEAAAYHLAERLGCLLGLLTHRPQSDKE